MQHEGAVCCASWQDMLAHPEQFCALDLADGTWQFKANVSPCCVAVEGARTGYTRDVLSHFYSRAWSFLSSLVYLPLFPWRRKRLLFPICSWGTGLQRGWCVMIGHEELNEAVSGEVQTAHQEKIFHWEDDWPLEQAPQRSGHSTSLTQFKEHLDNIFSYYSLVLESWEKQGVGLNDPYGPPSIWDILWLYD